LSSLLYVIGRWAFRKRKLVASLWIIILLALGCGAAKFNTGIDNSFTIPGTEAQEALDVLSRTFPQMSGTSAQFVIVAPPGRSVREADIATTVTRTLTSLPSIGHIAGATSPYDTMLPGGISGDGSTALVSVQFDDKLSALPPSTRTAMDSERERLQANLPVGSQVAVGGELYSQSLPQLGVAELSGVLAALIVLSLTFGSLLAAGLSLVTALLGVGISVALIYLSTLLVPISSTTPLLAIMLGLAVGIDYSLFIVSRYQGHLKARVGQEEAAARSVATSGSAVVFAGTTVIVALACLAVARIPFLTTMGISASISVAIAVLLSITLTPAVLGFAGRRLHRRRRAHLQQARPARLHRAGPAATPPGGQSATAEIPRGFFRNWVRAVTRHPVVTVVVIVGGLLVTIIPASQLKLALPDAGDRAQGDPAKVTYDLISQHFGPGDNGPLIVTGSIPRTADPVALMTRLGTEIHALPGVAAVTLASPNATADTGIIQVIPTSAPASAETETLVKEIRTRHQYFVDSYGANLAVTGETTIGIDVSARLGGALVPFGLLVVGISLILLTMLFRSVAVPIKAALGYIFSVSAAFGAVGAVYEWGWFADALNVTTLGPVISFMPIILTGVLFGLAMDYEVFLVSRIREDYVHGGDARRAVESGFVGSARVVTAAAIIMISVFAAFVPEHDAALKPIALGLAVGVFVDAFIVRMTLVPAILTLLGNTAWWIPRWLDRVLPSFDVEGARLQKKLDLAS